MSIARSNLPGAGAPKVTYNSATFFTRDEVAVQLAHELVEQRASLYGRVTKTRGGRMIEINLPLYGLWENLSTLFPSALINPTIGSRLFGTSDLPMVLHAQNTDRLTVHNVRLVAIADLKLAANQPVFSGAFRFMGLLKNDADPEDANSYFTYDTAPYTDSGFALTNFKSQTWLGAWGSRTGFTTILTEGGWDVSFEIGTSPDVVDGLGPVDMFIDNFWATASCIPVGPTAAQIESHHRFQGANAEVGSGLHASTDDLTLTSGSNTFVLKAAALASTGLIFAPSKKRIGPTVWECTRGFSAGAPQALAAVT